MKIYYRLYCYEYEIIVLTRFENRNELNWKWKRENGTELKISVSFQLNWNSVYGLKHYMKFCPTSPPKHAHYTHIAYYPIIG